MRGIILAGGTGSRLWPITRSISKQLMPIYDKPLIYYPLSTLILSGIREILIITTPDEQSLFKKLLKDGRQFGIQLDYEVQEKPEGLAQSFLIAEKFISGHHSCLILGDNIFYGAGLGRELSKNKEVIGSKILGFEVEDANRYGIAELKENGKVKSIEEKPINPKSNIAIPGLYFFDETVSSRAKSVGKSARGEYEITSVLQSYLEEDKLEISILRKGTAWMDCGTVDSMNDASNFVRILEERSGIKICCPEEIAWRNDWISDEELNFLATSYGSNNDYGAYLKKLARK